MINIHPLSSPAGMPKTSGSTTSASCNEPMTSTWSCTPASCSWSRGRGSSCAGRSSSVRLRSRRRSRSNPSSRQGRCRSWSRSRCMEVQQHLEGNYQSWRLIRCGLDYPLRQDGVSIRLWSIPTFCQSKTRDQQFEFLFTHRLTGWRIFFFSLNTNNIWW